MGSLLCNLPRYLKVLLAAVPELSPWPPYSGHGAERLSAGFLDYLARALDKARSGFLGGSRA